MLGSYGTWFVKLVSVEWVSICEKSGEQEMEDDEVWKDWLHFHCFKTSPFPRKIVCSLNIYLCFRSTHVCKWCVNFLWEGVKVCTWVKCELHIYLYDDVNKYVKSLLHVYVSFPPSLSPPPVWNPHRHVWVHVLRKEGKIDLCKNVCL